MRPVKAGRGVSGQDVTLQPDAYMGTLDRIETCSDMPLWPTSQELTVHVKRGAQADLPGRATPVTDPNERRRLLTEIARHGGLEEEIEERWPRAPYCGWSFCRAEGKEQDRAGTTLSLLLVAVSAAGGESDPSRQLQALLIGVLKDALYRRRPVGTRERDYRPASCSYRRMSLTVTGLMSNPSLFARFTSLMASRENPKATT